MRLFSVVLSIFGAVLMSATLAPAFADGQTTEPVAAVFGHLVSGTAVTDGFYCLTVAFDAAGALIDMEVAELATGARPAGAGTDTTNLDPPEILDLRR